MADTYEIIQCTDPLDDGVRVVLSGELDLSRSPALRTELLQVVAERHPRLVIDLTDVPYMDSSGVATLIEALQQVRQHAGRMILCGLQPKVRSIFEIARLDMVFTIVDTMDQAKQA